MASPKYIDFEALIEPVARRLLGEPNPKLSKPPKQLRFGTHGSISVDLTKGTFFDHECNVGGGVIDLVKHKTGCDHASAIAWLRSNAILSEDRYDWPPNASKGQSKRIAAVYDYVDEDGRALFQVVRYEPKGFSQRRSGTEPGTFIWGLNAGEYMRRGPGEDWLTFKDELFATWPPSKERATFDDVRRVLYRLPELMAAVTSGRSIYILEGEKDCENVCALGFSATTNPGGAGKWRHEYSEYFRSADVIIVGDNDQSGRDHVESVARSLHGIAKRIRVLDLTRIWPECPAKGDISKWLEAGGTADRLKALVEALPVWRAVESEAPRPLMRELPPPDPFPVDALGPVLAPVARAIHDRVQASLAICAQSVLAAATLVVQSRVDVVLPIGGKRTKPISSYFITIAESGERKTEADYQATWPIREHEKNLREKYDALAFAYTNDKEVWDKARATALKGAKGNQATAKSALDKLGPPPRPPLKPMLTSTEPTWEGLVKQFPDHNPSLGIFSSEGSQFIGGHAMNEENKLRTAGGLSELWDTGSARRVRAGDGAAIFPGRRVAMHLMVQPEVAALPTSPKSAGTKPLRTARDLSTSGAIRRWRLGGRRATCSVCISRLRSRTRTIDGYLVMTPLA
jgi:hypothetical protein